MRVPTKRRLAVGTIAAALLVPLGTIAAQSAPPSSFDVSPTPIASDVEVANTMRGQYSWYGINAAPEVDILGPDHYNRMFWNEVEATDGDYDPWKIEEGLAAAEETGGVYGFRIMAVCDWCSADMIVLPESLREDEGTWIAQGDSGPLEVPDWNSEAFLSQWEDLMAYLGERYDDDPRLGWVDVGGYGNWGEWHTYPVEAQYPGPDGQTDISLESSQRVIDAVVENFPNTNVVLSTTGNRRTAADGSTPVTGEAAYEWSNELWQYALGTTDRLGVRNDCLGAGTEQGHAREGLLEASRYAQEIGGHDPLERWRTAPFITEFCWATTPDHEWDDFTYGTFASALEQVEDWHISLLSSANYTAPLSDFSEEEQEAFLQSNLISGYRYVPEQVSGTVTSESVTVTTAWDNVNVAPTYQEWDVRYELREQGTGAVVSSTTSSVDLRTVLPDEPATVTDELDVSGLAAGSYDLVVTVLDPGEYFEPLGLGIEGRAADGSYLLSSVTVPAGDGEPAPTEPPSADPTPTESAPVSPAPTALPRPGLPRTGVLG